MLPAHDAGISHLPPVKSRPTTNGFWGSEEKTLTRSMITSEVTSSEAKKSCRRIVSRYRSFFEGLPEIGGQSW